MQCEAFSLVTVQNTVIDSINYGSRMTVLGYFFMFAQKISLSYYFSFKLTMIDFIYIVLLQMYIMKRE